MIYLLEALWYALLILLKIAFWPLVIIGGIALIARLSGVASRAIKAKKKKK